MLSTFLTYNFSTNQNTKSNILIVKLHNRCEIQNNFVFFIVMLYVGFICNQHSYIAINSSFSYVVSL